MYIERCGGEKRMQTIIKRCFKNLAGRRAVILLLLLFGGAFLISALYFLIRGKAQSIALSLLFLLLLLITPPIEQMLRLRIPPLGYGLLLFLMLGALLGSCYNFYFRISFWDTMLHGLSGFLFACIGYSVCKLMFSNSRGGGIFPYLLVGVLFSLSIALLWELFEAGATRILAVDMQEDTLLTSIKSFYLSGTHDYATQLTDIHETVIRYGNGQTLRLAGYLDLGLIDTLEDMAICFFGNLSFLLLFPLDRLLGGRLLPLLLPHCRADTAGK